MGLYGYQSCWFYPRSHPPAPMTHCDTSKVPCCHKTNIIRESRCTRPFEVSSINGPPSQFHLCYQSNYPLQWTSLSLVFVFVYNFVFVVILLLLCWVFLGYLIFFYWNCFLLKFWEWNIDIKVCLVFIFENNLEKKKLSKYPVLKPSKKHENSLVLFPVTWETCYFENLKTYTKTETKQKKTHVWAWHQIEIISCFHLYFAIVIHESKLDIWFLNLIVNMKIIFR